MFQEQQQVQNAKIIKYFYIDEFLKDIMQMRADSRKVDLNLGISNLKSQSKDSKHAMQ